MSDVGVILGGLSRGCAAVGGDMSTVVVILLWERGLLYLSMVEYGRT